MGQGHKSRPLERLLLRWMMCVKRISVGCAFSFTHVMHSGSRWDVLVIFSSLTAVTTETMILRDVLGVGAVEMVIPSMLLSNVLMAVTAAISLLSATTTLVGS